MVVTIDGSSDGSAAAARALPVTYPMRVLEQERGGPAAARNRCIEDACGDVVVFLDDDVVPDPELLSEHLAVHARDPRAVVIGPMLQPHSARLAPWLRWDAATLARQYDQMSRGAYEPSPRQFFTANASVRRAHLIAAGGFDERFTRAEDVELAYRLDALGLRFHFAAGARVYHEPDRTLATWLRVAWDYGRFAVTMAEGPVPYYLRVAYREHGARNPLTRWLTHWCVGHSWRTRAVVAALGYLVSRLDRVLPERATMAGCAALFAVQFWRGVAEEQQTGARLWGWLDASKAAAEARASAAASR